MVLPQERNPSAFGPWHSATTLASAILALGLVMAWPVERAQTAPADRPAVSESCAGGNEVSSFVCRNGWMAYLEHNNR